MELNPELGIACFTDGSAFTGDGSGGWSWVAVDAFDGYHSASGASWDATSNRMELTAGIEAMNYLFGEHGPCKVLIYSDSAYMVLGNQDVTRKRSANKDLWLSMDKAISQHTYIEWQHVSGHSGLLLNDRADQLAGAARKQLIKEKSVD